jgi:hypothetical protein
VSSRPPPPTTPAPPSSRRAGRSAPAPAPSKLPKTDPPRGAPRAESRAASPAERAARNASYALLAFTLFTALALTAWFAREDQPWGFSSFVAVLSTILGSGATALMWRRPTREHAIGGLAVMGLSIVRVGNPFNWATPSIALTCLALIAITALLAIPLVQAVIVLPRG